MPAPIEHASDDLKLALRAQTMISGFDDPDPELLNDGIDEEEEEEEIEDLDPDSIEVDESDRGDDLDPDMLDDEPDPDELDEEIDADDSASNTPAPLDADLLAEVAAGGKPQAVPYGRFAEVNSALRAEREARLRLEEELARAKGAAPAAPEVPAKEAEQPAAFDFEAAEDRYADALLEGDKELAKQVRAEIRAQERKQYEQQAATQVQRVTEQERAQATQAQEAASFQAAVDKAVKAYPFLDSQSAEANTDAIDDVLAHRNLLISRGISAAEALEQAVAKVAPRYATPTQAKPVIGSEKIQRNLERQSTFQQVPAGTGERAKDIDYAKLSDDEFDALSEADKRRARGDFVSQKD